MIEPEKNAILHANVRGKMLTLYSVAIRKEGSNDTERGYLIHDESDVNSVNDRISSGIVGAEAPENYEELDRMFRLAYWTADFHIDDHGCYVFRDYPCGIDL